MQRAMPTDVKTLFGSYIESVNDDLDSVDAVFTLIDKSPLGTAAGFGVPVFKVDQKMTAKEMGFGKVLSNPIYAQMSRGKYEGQILNVLASVMFTLNKVATDLMMFSMKEME